MNNNESFKIEDLESKDSKNEGVAQTEKESFEQKLKENERIIVNLKAVRSRIMFEMLNPNWRTDEFGLVGLRRELIDINNELEFSNNQRDKYQASLKSLIDSPGEDDKIIELPKN
ncbi:MAG: hypothetical protein ACOYMB_00590 [Patescibacteria group bacterium]